MADIATQLSQLNGVTFSSSQIGAAVGDGSGGKNYFGVGTDDHNFDIISVQDGASFTGNSILPSAGGVNGPGTLTVINTTHVPNYYNPRFPSYYYVTTFGQVSFSNLNSPHTVNGDPGGAIIFNVIGFSEEGLILSPNNVYTNGRARISYTFDNQTYYGLVSKGVFVLSPNGFGTADGVNFPETFGTDSSVFVAPVCFAEGTRIATATGATAVENLVEGDLVLTASGVERPIKWIGHMRVRPSGRKRPHEVNPIRVTAHAFGPDMPTHDVRLSPGHSVLVDGVLVPVGLLVNGATIMQEQVDEVRYFHIELETHDVLIAEGLPCESYLDDGNRMSFANAGEIASLHARLDPKSWDDACAPMVAAGPQLTALQQRLHDRAETMGWHKAEEPALSLVVDGAEIAPLHVAGNRSWFAVPAGAACVLRSNAGVLAHVMPGLGDGRRLGVAVSELRVDGTAVDLASDTFGAGFHPAERHEDHGWRWSDGAGSLALGLEAPAMIEVALAMVAPSWVRPALELRVVA